MEKLDANYNNARLEFQSNNTQKSSDYSNSGIIDKNLFENQSPNLELINQAAGLTSIDNNNTQIQGNIKDAKTNEIEQIKLSTKSSIYSEYGAAGKLKKDVLDTIYIMKKANSAWGFLLIPAELKGNAVAESTDSAIQDLINETSSISSNEKDIQSKADLLIKKSTYITSEFKSKFLILNTLINLVPTLLNLKQNGLSSESGLNDIVFGILNGMDASKPDYKNANNIKDLEKSFGKRIKNMFGKEFTPEKIEKKIKPLQDKQKMLEEKLKLAENKQNKQEIEKYKSLTNANKISLDLLLSIKDQFENTLKNITKNKDN